MFAVCSDWWKCSRPTQFPSTGVGAGNQSDAREVNCTTYHLRYSLALTSVHSLWPVVLSLIAIHPPNPLIHPFYNESVEVPCIYFLYGLVQTIYFSPVRLALDDYITTGIALVDRNSKREASSTPTVSPLVCWARLPQTYQLDELVKIGAIHLYATCRVTSSILVRFWYYILVSPAGIIECGICDLLNSSCQVQFSVYRVNFNIIVGRQGYIQVKRFQVKRLWVCVST